jgi:hypothetical protein
MKRTGRLLFLLLFLFFNASSQNGTVKVKKNCSLCGTWISIDPDSTHKGPVEEKKLVFEKSGDLLFYEGGNEKDLERGKWELRTHDTLRMTIDHGNGEDREVITCGIIIHKNDITLIAQEVGAVYFVRKKE